MTECNGFTWLVCVCVCVCVCVLVERVQSIVPNLLSKEQSSLLPQTQNISCKNGLFMYSLCNPYLLYFSKPNGVYWILLITQLTSVPIPVIINKACNNLGCVMYLQGIFFAIIFWDPHCGVLYHYISPKLLLFTYAHVATIRSQLLLPISEFGDYNWILILLKIYLNVFLHKERKGKRETGSDG